MTVSLDMVVAVIGSGPAGLVVMKELLETGIEVHCFEKADDLGGVFRDCYENARLTSSNFITSFSELPPEGDARFWTVPEYHQYLHAYACKFDLHRRISFGTAVQNVARDPTTGRYWVTVKRADGEVETRAFDRVAICSGTHQVPGEPDLPGLDRFTGRAVHSSKYRRAADYAGKRVLIVGGGESGSDICHDVSRVAKSTCISLRGKHGLIVPRTLGGSPPFDLDTSRVHYSMPVWVSEIFHFCLFFAWWIVGSVWALWARLAKRRDSLVLSRVVRKWAWMNLRNHRNPQTKFGTKNFGLVEAIVAHGCVRKPGIESIEAAKVKFVDGTEHECDEIIFTTGYRNAFPFLGEGLQEIAAEAIDPRKFYKHCIHPRLGAEVVWCGFARPAFGAVPPIAEMQARWIALLCSGARALPDVDDMQAIIARDAQREWKQFADDAGRIRSLTDYLSYMDDVAGLIGCRPQLWKLWWSDRRVWWRVMLGPVTGSQYRLTGPGSRTEAARQTLLRTPVLWGPGYVYLVISLFFQLLACTGLPFFKAPPALARQPYRQGVPGPERQKTTPTPNLAGSDHPL